MNLQHILQLLLIVSMVIVTYIIYRFNVSQTNKQKELVEQFVQKISENNTNITKIGKINQMSAYAFLSAFGDFKKFEGDKKARLVAAMKTMRDGLDEKLQESLHKQLGVMLKGC